MLKLRVKGKVSLKWELLKMNETKLEVMTQLRDLKLSWKTNPLQSLRCTRIKSVLILRTFFEIFYSMSCAIDQQKKKSLIYLQVNPEKHFKSPCRKFNNQPGSIHPPKENVFLTLNKFLPLFPHFGELPGVIIKIKQMLSAFTVTLSIHAPSIATSKREETKEKNHY